MCRQVLPRLLAQVGTGDGMSPEGEFRSDRVAVIGAHGRMGRMFCTRFRAAGLDVVELDQPLTELSLRAGLSEAGVILLCIPAAVFDSVLQQIRDIIRPPQVLVDITSVKVQPMHQMQRTYAGPIVGTHPLFGPEPKKDEVRVAVTPADGTDEACVAMVENLFSRIGCEPFRTTAEEHDEAAALIQGLNFITTVSYLATLAHKDEITPYLTPSFQRRLDAARKMLTEDAELFEGLFEANPSSQNVVRSFRNMLNIAAGGDVNVLVERALWWWREDNDTGGVRQ